VLLRTITTHVIALRNGAVTHIGCDIECTSRMVLQQTETL